MNLGWETNMQNIAVVIDSFFLWVVFSSTSVYLVICLDAKYCECYFVGCWVFLSICRCSWALLWDAVNLETIWSLGIVLLWFFFFLGESGVVLSVGLICLYFWGKIFLSTLLIAPKLWPLGTGLVSALCAWQVLLPLILLVDSFVGLL